MGFPTLFLRLKWNILVFASVLLQDDLPLPPQYLALLPAPCRPLLDSAGGPSPAPYLSLLGQPATTS